MNNSTAKLTPFNQLRETIANLSTHDRFSYYKSPYKFLCKVSETLQEFGYTTPQFELYLYNNSGCGYISIEKNNVEVGKIHYTYYRMPSYNWEFVCYII